MPAPERLDRFDIIQLLGRGGMGEVYLARDPLIDRLVAIKLLAAAFDARARARFTREARAAGGLQHENIVTVFDVGEHENRPFIAMEYVPGDTVASLIRREPPRPLPEMLRLVEDACVGLGFAHRAGVVHLDVKPENLIRRTDGRLKVVDFGIANVVDTDDTRTRQVLGTLRYMSPEQLTGGAVDHRSDVFGLGCVLYEVVARRPAFGGSVLDAVSRLGGAATPLSEACPGVHPGLARITERALALDPADRYPDLDAFCHELVGVRQQIEAGTTAESTLPKRSTLVRPVAGALAAVVVATLWWLRPTDVTPPPLAVVETPAVLATTPPLSLEASVREAVDAHDQRRALRLLRNQPTSAPGLVAELLAAARSSAVEARSAADARGITARQSPTYRQAVGRVSQARLLENSEQAVESLSALWEAVDLFERATAVDLPQLAFTPTQPKAPSAANALPAAPVTDSTPPAPDASELPAFAAPASGVGLGDSTPVATGDRRLPVRQESASGVGPANSPVEAIVRQLLTPEEAVRATLQAYESAYDQRDLGALRRVFPSLSAAQADAIGRMFGGAINYRLDLRVVEMRVDATTATATCEVTHELVPRVGNVSRNAQRSTFSLAPANGVWVIKGVQSSVRQ